jgi:quinol-cytochrome oxidoreductase complex cytochrome b subunit/coenzyme F420-reducing hydrogenase delta subunit
MTTGHAAVGAAPPPGAAPTGRLRLAGLALWHGLELPFDRAFGSALNPLRHLGALAFLCLWLLAISGVYLYAVIDTSVAGAYRSIAQLSQQPWSVGGVLRSMHRYAADAFVLLMAAHLLREALYGRYQGFRRYSWLTGVPLVVFVFVSAIGGFWLHWDQLGLYSAQATAEWFDSLPLLATPLARNFLTADAVNDRLFSLFVFVHLGVPLLLLFGLWFHIQRIARAAVFPPRPLALGLVLLLLGLALLLPVAGQGAADVGTVPAALALDWILLFVHPLVAATSGAAVWLAVAALLALLLLLPFLPQPVRAAAAQVDPGNCNGCRRCFEDCPYAAVTMAPHPNLRLGKELAVVNADLCAGCGICAGACPSSTPFRSVAELVTGIDMPQQPVSALRRQLQQGLAGCTAERPIVVFGCRCAVPLATLAAADVVPIELICSGQLPPSFVDYALRDGAAGVLVTGCAEGSCDYRFGQRWTRERLQGQREPHLRADVAPGRWAMAWAGAHQTALLAAALQTLRRQLQGLASTGSAAGSAGRAARHPARRPASRAVDD